LINRRGKRCDHAANYDLRVSTTPATTRCWSGAPRLGLASGVRAASRALGRSTRPSGQPHASWRGRGATPRRFCPCARSGARGRARWTPSRRRSSRRPCARSARSPGVPRAMTFPGGRVEAAGTLAARGGEVGGVLPLVGVGWWAWAAACGDGEPRGVGAVHRTAPVSRCRRGGPDRAQSRRRLPQQCLRLSTRRDSGRPSKQRLDPAAMSSRRQRPAWLDAAALVRSSAAESDRQLHASALGGEQLLLSKQPWCADGSTSGIILVFARWLRPRAASPACNDRCGHHRRANRGEGPPDLRRRSGSK